MTVQQSPVRVVVTGVGVVSPVGIGRDAFWKNLLAGKCGIDFLRNVACEGMPTRLGAEIRDFDPLKHLSQKKMVKVMARDIQLGVAASNLAVSDAGIMPGMIDPDRFGVEFGAGRIASHPEEFAAAVESCKDALGDFDYGRWNEQAMQKIAPLWLLRILPNMPACHVSIEHDARGPNNTITSRDSSALLALAEAVWVIQRGAADCMIVGASSSNISPVDILKLGLYEGLSPRDHDPEKACRPFDRQRDGAIVGEGAAAFIVEEYEHARRRGAEIYAEVLGVGAGCDGAGHANQASGTGLVRAMETAMRLARIAPNEIGHINAHGKSTQRDDLVEARAYHRALGAAADTIPVTALKSYFGYFDAGSGAVELAGSLLALKHGELPLTLNYEFPDPRCRVNVVHDQPIRLQSRTAISVNRTAMGQSAAAIVRAI